jgi:putative cardiolipin synthase
VHSGYRPWRRKLLGAGVELYEYRSDAGASGEILAPGFEGRFLSLHTKTFVIDREFVYIGSLNMDPRSFRLNTEFGLMIAAPALAEAIAGLVELDISPDNAWRVSLDDENRLVWQSSDGDRFLQPARGFGQRITDFFYSLLPIKDQL